MRPPAPSDLRLARRRRKPAEETHVRLDKSHILEETGEERGVSVGEADNRPLCLCRDCRLVRVIDLLVEAVERVNEERTCSAAKAKR